jgi:type IV pilus assembly protein PilF
VNQLLSKLGKQTFGIVLLGFCTLVLSACVTTTETLFTEEASPQKTLEKRVGLARQYIGEGDWENAERNLTIAAEIDKGNADVYEAFAMLYQSTGEDQLAEQNFETAIKLKRKFSRARNNYAAFLYSQGRYHDAEEQLEEVVIDTLYSGRPRAFINLGLCRVQLLDYDGAEQAFLTALSMDRGNSMALIEVAELRYRDDDFESSYSYYQKYRRSVRQQGAQGLWLGIQIARSRGDDNAEASYVLALTNLYPNSGEYQEYLRDADSGQ